MKFRESFRPFAPAILAEQMDEWFERLPEPDHLSPLMLRVARFRQDRIAEVPGVVHVDGTGRVQKVLREEQEVFATLLQRFYELTGVPMLLNTSLDRKSVV